MIEQPYLNKILSALDKQIGAHKGVPIHIVVCGGSALIFLGLTTRATTDIDILGQLDANATRVMSLEQLPDWFEAAAEKVKRDFNLPGNWVNTGPASQVSSGLPEGLAKRLIYKKYGKFLSVSYISRVDQIFLKLYASIDRGGYHVDDLMNLNPTETELKRAAEWVLTQDVSREFRLLLIRFLKHIGFTHVAETI
ncbi:MAG: hypothetical protein DRJ14_02290 [Acidobacteria bacterium]|nr:MAG: hypothetical protein DRJ14_02290 [Acidobacteriota bacterium]